MSKSTPFPITEENFPQCWEYIDHQRRRARKQATIANVGGFLSQMTLLLSLLFFIHGLICRYMDGGYSHFLWSIPFFSEIWGKISLLLSPDSNLLGDVVKLAILAYLTAILVFLIVYGVLFLLYHPRKKATPTLSYGENTSQLSKLAQDALDNSYKSRIGTSRFALVITIILTFILFFTYIYVLQDSDKILALLTQFPTNDAATNALLYVLAAYFVISGLCAILLLITRPLYRFNFPHDLVVQSETTALLTSEEFSCLSPEDLPQKAAAIREEAISLEKQNGYFPAKKRFYQAALLGDVSAMEHYARHCLLLHMNDSAHYWLNKCISSGSASKEAQRMHRRLQFRLRHNVEYLHADGSLTSRQKHLKALGSFAIKLLSLVLVFALTIGVGLWSAKHFAPEGTEISLSGLLESIIGMQEAETEATTPESETIPAETYTITLTETDTKWKNGCIAYHSDGSPVVYGYSLAQGGDLTVPYSMGDGEKLRFAGIYFGNKWDVRKITQHVTVLEEELVISETYLTGMKPGEYFITMEIANPSGQVIADRYFPLVVQE